MRRGPKPGTALPINLDNARAAWAGDLPDWVEALACECDRSSQARAATRLGYAASTICSVLSRSYRGSYPAVETRSGRC